MSCGNESCMWSLHGARDILWEPPGRGLQLPVQGAVVDQMESGAQCVTASLSHMEPHSADTTSGNAGCCRACGLGAGGWEGCDGAAAAGAQGGEPDCTGELL